MIKALFFDNDGVLVDTEHLIYQSNQKAFDQMGIPYTQADYENHTMHNNLGSKGWLLKQGHDETVHTKFKALRDAAWKDHLKNTNPLLPEVETTIKLLQNAELTIGLCTSAPAWHLALSHYQTGLLSEFAFTLSCDDVPQIKPNPDIYLKALDLAQVKPEEALVIEDTPRGIAAGNAAGIRTVAIPHGMTTDFDFSTADFILSNITELPNLINQLNHNAA